MGRQFGKTSIAKKKKKLWFFSRNNEDNHGNDNKAHVANNASDLAVFPEGPNRTTNYQKLQAPMRNQQIWKVKGRWWDPHANIIYILYVGRA